MTRIRKLRAAAAEAGDHAMVLICDIAEGYVVLDADTTIDSLQISVFISPADKRRIAEHFGTADTAQQECARVIEENRS